MDEIEKNNGEIIIYRTEDGRTQLEVRLENENVWLSQQQMSKLFQTSRTNIVEHIKHIFEEGELEENSTCQIFRQVGDRRHKKGREEVYLSIILDMIISLGYKSKITSCHPLPPLGSTERLKEYLIKGFAMDDQRLKRNRRRRLLVNELLKGRHLAISVHLKKYSTGRFSTCMPPGVDYDPEKGRRIHPVFQNRCRISYTMPPTATQQQK